VFYSRRKQSRGKQTDQHDGVFAALKSLGLLGVTKDELTRALVELFPAGTETLDTPEVIRAEPGSCSMTIITPRPS
jgi:hypothetical protein